MRIRGAKTELEEAGLETDGMVESTAKLREEILALTDVDIMEADGDTFKSTYKIMEELAEKWQDLSDIQQATVTELIAGKRQGNIVSSLMSNFEIAEQALETSLNSSGSAMQEHEKWQQSLEAQINKLKAAWQSLSQSFLSSDFLKSALDAVIALVNGLDKLVSTFGTLPSLFTLFAGGRSLFGGKGLFNLTFNRETGSIKLFADSFSKLGDKYSLASTKIAKYNALSASSQAKLRAQWANSTTSFGRYISGLNGAKATMGGYITSLVGAKVATFALQAASMALNMALTMGVSAAITWLISKFDDWIETSEELKERIEEVTSKYKEQHNSLMKLQGDYDTSNEDSLISKYGELSKGVNSLGENISLTADEYSEYQSIVDTIAEQIPSLVTGYNSQGDAILSCAGDVDKLAESYRNLIKEQDAEVLESGSDIFKDFRNDLKGSSAYHKTSKTETRGNTQYTDYFEHYDTEHIKNLEDLITLKEENSAEDIKTLVGELSYDEQVRISELLDEYGIERDLLFTGEKGYETYSEHIIRALTEDKAEIQNILKEASADLNAYAEDMGTVSEAFLSTAFLGGDGSDVGDYSDLSEKMQNAITQATSNLGADFYSQFLGDDKTSEQSYKEFIDYYNNMLDKFKNLDTYKADKFEAAFDLKTQFNGGEISYGEYVNGIREANNIIDEMDLDPEIENQLKLSLNTKEVTDNYEALKIRLTSDKYGIQMKTDEAEKFLNGLTASEYAVAVDLMMSGEVDLSEFDIDSLRNYIEEEAKVQEALSFNANIEADTTALETLNTALEESASAMGLTSESINSLESKYSDLEGYDAAKLFESTANGVKVNREELAKLEDEYNDLTKSEVQEHIESLTDAYNDNIVAIDECTNATERARLISENETYKTKIEELATYQAQLEGVTGAYQRWIDAQSGPEDYDGYEGIATNRENVEDELSRGFIGNATKEYIDLLSGEDLQGGNIDDYAEAWEKLDDTVTSTGYSIHDFFTLNEDGDITATGIDRFFKSVKKDIEGIYDADTGIYDFSEDNLKAIQDEYGMGVEAIQLLLEAAQAAGYKIDWGGILDGIDLATADFETLVELAESAQEKFNNLNLDGIEKLDFNFTTTNVEDATSELEKAQEIYTDLITDDKGNINLEAEGADEMRDILAVLTKQKQELERPAIMDVEIPFKEAESDIGKATAAVKNLQDNLWKLEQSVYDPDINSENVQAEINNIISELNTLEQSDPEIYAKLGLDNAQISGLKTAIENIQADIKAGVEPSQEDLDAVQSTIKGIDATVVANVLTGEVSGTTGTATITPKASTTDLGDDFFGNATITPNPLTLDLGTNFTGEGTISVAPNKTNLGSNFTGSGTINLTPNPTSLNVTVTGYANGTANVDGTAFANGTVGRAFTRGDWGIKGSGTALVGELGMETLVRGGRFYTIGDNGAEFIKYRQGDIIFNHKQTEELFKNGKVTSDSGRGKMFANGSAFADGNYLSSGRAFWKASATESSFASKRKDGTSSTFDYNNVNVYNNDITYNSSKSKSSSSKSSSSSSSSSSDDFEETLDWIETKIDRIERAIDRLDQTANSTYKSWSERNKALVNEISKVEDEIAIQQAAYERYIKEANSVGLSESWATKVRNGEIDIETITNESLADKIKEYTEW